MRTIYKFFIIIFISSVFIYAQKESRVRAHNFSGNTVGSITGIFNLSYTDFSNSKIGFGAAAMAEYFIPTSSPSIFGLRLLFGGQSIRGHDKFKVPEEFMTDMYILGGGLTYGFTFDNEFFPYIYAGVSNLWFSPKDKNGKRLINNSQDAYSRSTIAFDSEVGSRIILHDKLSIFFGAGVHFVQTDNFDDITARNNDDYYFTGRIGFSYTLFGKKDSDGDGIWDSDDMCPSNAEDYDGFQDEDGCPDFDNDKDGIPDVKDRCPNDPEDFDGFQDQDGCPDLDNDGDGIPDKKDKCPNEPENFNGFEDEDGCPDILSGLQDSKDRDGDGIPNNIDQCPDEAETFNGFEDEDGCPDSVTQTDTVSSSAVDSVKEIILEGSILFDFRGSVLKPTALNELNKLVIVLEKDPFIKWLVEGYTDNNGNPDSLKNLSQQRAIEVIRYLVNQGLPSFMFKFAGKGAEFPIADNNNLEGRIKNNRIVLRRLD